MDFKYESINNTILNMLYLPNQIKIKCDFVLTNEDTIFKGKAKIMRDEEYIEIKGSLEDYITSVTKNSNIINISDIPSESECSLSNLPKENMKKDIINIVSKIQPLYSNKSGEIMILSCN